VIYDTLQPEVFCDAYGASFSALVAPIDVINVTKIIINVNKRVY